MIEWISGILLMSGSFFMLVAAIGVVKFADVYSRMHAITKAASLGMILMLTAVILLFPTAMVIIEAILTLLFVVMTAPVGTHMIAHIAYKMNVPKGMPYVIDEMDPDL